MTEQVTPSVSLASLLLTMVDFQHKTNKQFIGENYIQTPPPFEDAILVETAEMFDSSQYKWWKESELDSENIKTELIDIWHFVLSLLTSRTCRNDEDVPHYAQRFAGLHAGFFNGINIDSDAMKALIPEVNAPALRHHAKVLNRRVLNREDDTTIVLAFAECLAAAGLSFMEFYARHMVKNALNKLRQDLGDKEGKYSRQWKALGQNPDAEEHSTKEDNYVALELILGNNISNFEDIYNTLKDYYVSNHG